MHRQTKTTTATTSDLKAKIFSEMLYYRATIKTWMRANHLPRGSELLQLDQMQRFSKTNEQHTFSRYFLNVDMYSSALIGLNFASTCTTFNILIEYAHRNEDETYPILRRLKKNSSVIFIWKFFARLDFLKRVVEPRS